jgi:hypothetical protein
LGKNMNTGKTHCKNGHEFTPENTRVSSQGYRTCKTCQKAYLAGYYLTNKDAYTARTKVWQSNNKEKVKETCQVLVIL